MNVQAAEDTDVTEVPAPSITTQERFRYFLRLRIELQRFAPLMACAVACEE